MMEKFDAHFDVHKNVIFEHVRFNQRKQLDGETAEEYHTRYKKKCIVYENVVHVYCMYITM